MNNPCAHVRCEVTASVQYMHRSGHSAIICIDPRTVVINRVAPKCLTSLRQMGTCCSSPAEAAEETRTLGEIAFQEEQNMPGVERRLA